MMTASLRASATLAFFIPLRLASFIAQSGNGYVRATFSTSLDLHFSTSLDLCGIHGLSPICMTRLVAEPDPAYIRSAVRDGGTNIPLAADKGFRTTKPFLETAVQAIHHLGSSTWIRQ